MLDEKLILGGLITVLISAVVSWIISVFKNNLATREELSTEINKLKNQFDTRFNELKDSFNQEGKDLKDKINYELTELKLHITELTVIIKENFSKKQRKEK